MTETAPARSTGGSVSVPAVSGPPAAAPPVVVADDLSLVYPARAGQPAVRAVDGVTLSVGEGEIVAVLGESGSGKSSLAAALAGLVQKGRPAEGLPSLAGGDLRLLGDDIASLSRRRRDRLAASIGYLAQEDGDHLHPDLSVGEVIASPLYERDRKFDRKEAGMLVATLIDAVHLPLGTITKRSWELSAGQRQRVALARSLVLEPRLLIADEPARGVDVLVRRSVLELLRSLHANRRFSAVVVTSSVEEARAVADRVAVLRGGRLVGLGPLDDVLASTFDPYVKVLSQTTPVDIIPPESRRPKQHRLD